MASRNAIPSVSGTKRKWYIAVKANCKARTVRLYLTSWLLAHRMKTPRVNPVRKGHTHAPIQNYLLASIVAISSKRGKDNDKKVTNALMNKPNWSRNYITPQNPYNKQVFIEQICIFRQWSIYSEIVTISPIWSTTIYRVLQYFFQELKIDLYQNQPHMLIMCESWATGNFIVNLL